MRNKKLKYKIVIKRNISISKMKSLYLRDELGAFYYYIGNYLRKYDKFLTNMSVFLIDEFGKL